MADVWLTQEEYNKREERLEYLKGDRRLEIAEMLKVARAFGDLSENAEYDAAKNEQAKNEYDIATLESELRSAHVIDENILTGNTVAVGATVSMHCITANTDVTYQIVGSAEADPVAGKISNESPIGGALLHHMVGDVVEVATPAGMVEFKILRIGK